MLLFCIWWGSGDKIFESDVVGTMECPDCGSPKPFCLYCHYEYGHVYGLFRWVKSEEYQCVCTSCKTRYALDKEAAHAAFGNPIGAGVRYGCLIGIVAFIGLCILSAITR